jgi:hypothetical protein
MTSPHAARASGEVWSRRTLQHTSNNAAVSCNRQAARRVAAESDIFFVMMHTTFVYYIFCQPVIFISVR